MSKNRLFLRESQLDSITLQQGLHRSENFPKIEGLRHVGFFFVSKIILSNNGEKHFTTMVKILSIYKV